eukprot:ANDGO_04137.mRNA.1 Dpy-30 motif protein
MKIFISHLDSYLGRVLSRLVLKQCPGATIAGMCRSEESVAYVEQHVTKEIVSPLKSLEEYKTSLLTSQIIFFELMQGVEDASYAFKIVNAGNFPDQKLFIGISSVLSWSDSYPKKLSAQNSDGSAAATTKEQEQVEQNEAGGAEEPEAEAEAEAEEEKEVLTEDMYHKRKAHAAYGRFKDVEKLITGGVKNPRLGSYVVFAGLAYGEGEDILHDLFRQAWCLEPEQLSVLGKGKNIIPMIHVKDLAQGLLRLALVEEKPDIRYLLAVDDANSTQLQVVETISKVLGTGKPVKHVTGDAILLHENAEFFLVDLKMAPGAFKDLEGFEWHCQAGFVESVRVVVGEFKAVRKLQAVRVVVDGPPAVGKTNTARRLARKLRVPHVTARTAMEEFSKARPDIVKEAMDKLKESLLAAEQEIQAAAPKKGNAKTPVAVDPKEEEEKRKKLERSLRWDDALLIRAVRFVLLSPRCRNHGYVLDGFPKSYKQARMIFRKMNTEEGAEGELEEEVEDVPMDGLDVNERIDVETARLMPELVVVLKASSDDVLRLRTKEDRIAHAVAVEKGEDPEARFERRLQVYANSHQATGNNPVHFFDVHQVRLTTVDTADRVIPAKEQATLVGAKSEEEELEHEDMATLETKAAEEIAQQIEDFLGGARNYGPSDSEKALVEERARLRHQKEEEERVSKEKENAQRLEQEKREQEHKEREQQSRLKSMKDAERQILEERAKPLRRYLMEAVVPTLTTGLIEVCKLRPQDPVDFLAEYLFRHNPLEDEQEN